MPLIWNAILNFLRPNGILQFLLFNKYTAKYTGGIHRWSGSNCQQIWISVPIVLKCMEFFHKALPCLAGEGTDFSSHLIFPAKVSVSLTGLPTLQSRTEHWKKKQYTDEVICHSALSSYYHDHCTATHLTGSLCYFSHPFSELCCTVNSKQAADTKVKFR